jgi:hypothetical protein
MRNYFAATGRWSYLLVLHVRTTQLQATRATELRTQSGGPGSWGLGVWERGGQQCPKNKGEQELAVEQEQRAKPTPTSLATKPSEQLPAAGRCEVGSAKAKAKADTGTWHMAYGSAAACCMQQQQWRQQGIASSRTAAIPWAPSRGLTLWPRGLRGGCSARTTSPTTKVALSACHLPFATTPRPTMTSAGAPGVQCPLGWGAWGFNLQCSARALFRAAAFKIK